MHLIAHQDLDTDAIDPAFTKQLPHWGEQYRHSWVTGAMQSSATFHSQILAAASHYLVNRRSVDPPPEKFNAVRVKNKARAIEGLRSEIQRYRVSPERVSMERLLMPMFTLAINNDIDLVDEDEEVPITALSQLMEVQIYSRMKFGDEHADILFRLIADNGGLGSIDSAAFGSVIPL